MTTPKHNAKNASKKKKAEEQALAAAAEAQQQQQIILSDEDIWVTFDPFLRMGLLKNKHVEAVLKAPLRERMPQVQLLVLQGLELRQQLRRLCAECGKADVKLKVCGKCGNIWYCSRECQLANWASIHKTTCTGLKIARICQENEHTRAEIADEWADTYIKGLQGQSLMHWPKKHIPTDWNSFFAARGLVTVASPNNNSGMCLSELLHEGLTIALAAKRFGLVGEAEEEKDGGEGKRDKDTHTHTHSFPKDRPFRLHILGAVDSQECARLPLTMGELYALFCPHFYTKGIEISLFGPQLASNLTSFRVPLSEALSPDITVEKYSTLYHEWVLRGGGDNTHTQTKPDLIVAFNSGMHTGDSHREQDGSVWMPTVAYLVKAGIPTVLTMYDMKEGTTTHEILTRDHAEDFLADVKWGPELNPFRSMVLEASEPPHAHRYGGLVADKKVVMGEEVEEGMELEPLDLKTCNHTSGNSRVWLGFCGEKV